MYPGKHAFEKADQPCFIMAGSGEVVTYGEYEARTNRLAHLLRDVVDAVAGLAFDVHVVAPEGAAGPDTVTGVQVLWNMLLADREAPPAVRPEPDLELARAIADATRAALSELPGSVADDLCAVALVTTGDGLRPYLTVTVDVDERWDLAASESLDRSDVLTSFRAAKVFR